MALIRKLFWLAIFLISTLSFVVLFEKGTDNFTENFVKQAQDFRAFVEKQIKPPEDARKSAPGTR